MPNDALLSQIQHLLEAERDHTRKLIREEVGGLEEGLAAVKQDVADLKHSLASLNQDVADVKQDMVVVKQDMANVKKDVAEVKQTLHTEIHDMALNIREILDNMPVRDQVEQRLKHIEDEIGMPSQPPLH